MLVGTSHSDQAAAPDDTRVLGAELRSFVAEVNSAFPALGLTEQEVTLVHRGVVPAVRDRQGVLGLMGHHRIHDHEGDGVAGALSVAGVKYTTARGVAEQVVDLIVAKLGAVCPACRTGSMRLPHWDFAPREAEVDRAQSEVGDALPPETVAALVSTHGTAWQAIAARVRRDAGEAEPLSAGSPIPLAAVHRAIDDEMACTLCDVLIRRLPVGAARYPGDEVVARCGSLMAARMGWDARRTAAETEAVRAFYRVW
jgi:glycerol-3-phosphate dehydrogenase